MRARKVLVGAGLVALVALGAATLLDDEDVDGGNDVEDAGSTTTAPGGTSTTVVDLHDQAPLLGEVTGLAVAIDGQSNVLVGLDDGSVQYFAVGGGLPFNPVDAALGGMLTVGDLGVQVWAPPYDGRDFTTLDELGATGAVAGDTVVWSVDTGTGRARVLRLTAPPGLLGDITLPSGAVVAGAIGDALVVGAPGGTFAIEPDGSSRLLAAGHPLAADGGLALVSRCSGDLACEVHTVDGGGDVVQALPLAGPDPITAAAVGPGGQVAWIAGHPGAGSVVVDGRTRFPLPATGVTTLDWSPDGRWLVGSFGRRNLWFLDTVDGPTAEPVIVDLEQNVYPVTVHFVPVG